MVLVECFIDGKKNTLYCDNRLLRNIEGKIRPNVSKKDKDQVFVVDGEEGCLAGDTLIQVSRFKLSRKYKIERLYNHFHQNPDGIIHKNKMFDLNEISRVRSFNGKDIRLNKMIDVTYSGVKDVYKLELENNMCLKATAGHKIMTKDGWVELCNLKVGDEVMCDTLHPKKNGRKKIKFYDIQLRVGRNHPYTKNGRVEVHRLIYESSLNKISFREFVDKLLNEPDVCKNFKFIDPNVFDIHHKDGCHYNNCIDNLELLSKQEHNVFHNEYSNFSQGVPVFNKVLSVTFVGKEKVYDIECEHPNHNFVANGIIVHNSGKSVFAMQLAKLCDTNFDIKRMCFTPDEFTKAVVNARKGECVVFDEAFTGLSSRGSLSAVNKLLVSLMMEMRQKNLFVIIVMPTFFLLDKYVALWRAKGLFHVYTKNGKRGYWMYFNRHKKKILYLKGKVTYNYSWPRSRFYGRFFDKYTVNEAEYRRKKGNALMNKKRNTANDNFLKQRNVLLYTLSKDFDLSKSEIVRLLNKNGFEMTASNVYQGIKDVSMAFEEHEDYVLPVKRFNPYAKVYKELRSGILDS